MGLKLCTCGLQHRWDLHAHLHELLLDAEVYGLGMQREKTKGASSILEVIDQLQITK